MKRLAVSCIKDKHRVYVSYCPKDGINFVSKKHATLFSMPSYVNMITTRYQIDDPQIEVVEVFHEREIYSEEDKYTIFKEVLSEESGEVAYGYNFFLFSMLWYQGKEIEYDLAYDMILESYNKFLSSNFNVDAGLYECISGFLANEKKKKESEGRFAQIHIEDQELFELICGNMQVEAKSAEVCFIERDRYLEGGDNNDTITYYFNKHPKASLFEFYL